MSLSNEQAKLINVYAYQEKTQERYYRILQMPKALNGQGLPDWTKGSKPVLFGPKRLEQSSNPPWAPAVKSLATPGQEQSMSNFVNSLINNKKFNRNRKIRGFINEFRESSQTMYSQSELSGKGGREQHDASEAFDQTNHAYGAMPITNSYGLYPERVIVVTVDLNLLQELGQPELQITEIPTSKNNPNGYSMAYALLHENFVQPCKNGPNVNQEEGWEKPNWVIDKCGLWLMNPANKSAIETYKLKLAAENKRSMELVNTVELQNTVKLENTIKLEGAVDSKLGAEMKVKKEEPVNIRFSLDIKVKKEETEATPMSDSNTNGTSNGNTNVNTNGNTNCNTNSNTNSNANGNAVKQKTMKHS